jgi:predicted nucleotidyltransferase
MKSATSDDPVLQDFLKGIEQVRPLISKLILFGSRAKGTHRLDSDYDLLLVVDRKEDALVDVLYEAVMDVLLAHGRLVSLKIFPKAEFDRLQALHTPFMTHVVEEGVRLG